MPALSSRHGTAFRLLRIGALIVACLVFLWGCEVSRSATLGDVPEYLVLAGLAAVGGLAAAWFEIRAVRAARRTVTMDDGRWRVVARVAGDGALVFVGHDEEPEDSDDPEDAPSGWVWTFPAESIDAVRGVLASGCFPGDDPGELAELELLDLLVEAAEVLDPVARADPGAWLHGHGVRGERHEWGVDPAQTTRTLPIVGTPLAGPGRGAKRRGARASPAAGDAGGGRAADPRGAAERGSAGGGARPGGGSSPRSARRGADSASTLAEPNQRSARPRDPAGPGGRPERSARPTADSGTEPEARARRGAPADRGSGRRRGESAARAGRGQGSGSTAVRGANESAGRAPRGGEPPETGPGAAAERDAAPRARRGTGSERDAEAATDRTVARRARGAQPDPAARRSADRAEPPVEQHGEDQRYSGPIRRRGAGRQQRQDAGSWWETADGPTDRTYREPPPPRLSTPRRRRDD
ncbi:hypothetical protein [Nocardia harenae]|uniref:hypothetical protein n=1 Tax=Nocardia harenae TaxID=358707 RepID=UPI00082BA549|nr:hypothetical protein [Nocardia harenae]